MGSFPGPCFVIFIGTDYEATPTGVTEVVVDAVMTVSSQGEHDTSREDMSALRRITSVEDLVVLGDHTQALWIEAADPTEIVAQLSLDTCDLVVLAVPSMQADNAEIHQSKVWPKISHESNTST